MYISKWLVQIICIEPVASTLYFYSVNRYSQCKVGSLIDCIINKPCGLIICDIEVLFIINFHDKLLMISW